MANRELCADFERMMVNWSKWLLGSNGGSGSVNSIYLMAGPSRSRFVAQASVPVLSLEASQVDGVVHRLPVKLAEAVRAKWTSSLGVHYLAIRCRCSERTFYNRVDRAHAEIGAMLHKRVFVPMRYVGTPHPHLGLSNNLA